MITAVLLDSGPLGLLVHQRGGPSGVQCRQWLAALAQKGVRVIVPEIIDYELRRELIRINLTAAINDLNVLIGSKPDRYLPLTTDTMRTAAALWAQARKAGRPTTHAQELDVDVILAAQALSLNLPPAEFIVATTNVTHLSRFVPAAMWMNI